MLNFLIKDGNLKEWVRIFFVFLGIAFVALGVVLEINSLSGFFFFAIGFFIAAIGGYASQAHTLKLRPFDRNNQRSRRSYEKKR